MQVSTALFTVAEYCDQMKSGTITVNAEYQRSDRVWPPAARSYLIETMLLGFPIPKLSLYQTTDLKSRRTRKEIVDGQQRSKAIFDFFNDKLRLSGRTEFAGNLFSQLEEVQQQKFVDYQIAVDVFVGATDNEIRQVFRRMNSYTVPLNPQEKRHATYQGRLKWFIVEMTDRYSEALKALGVFSEKQLSRMADAALFCDILYTIENGIQSASEVKLDKYYQANDAHFTGEALMRARFEVAINKILEWPELHKTALCKPYNFFSLFTALAHAVAPSAALSSDYPRAAVAQINSQGAIQTLSTLSDALERPYDYPQMAEFVSACEKATNRIDPRRTRFVWMSRSIDSLAL